MHFGPCGIVPAGEGATLDYFPLKTLQTKGFRDNFKLNKRLATTISDVLEMLRTLEKTNHKKRLAG